MQIRPVAAPPRPRRSPGLRGLAAVVASVAGGLLLTGQPAIAIAPAAGAGAPLAAPAAPDAQSKTKSQAKQRAEAEARKRAQADAKRRAQAESRKRAEADARRRAQADAQRRAQADARKRAEADARRRAQADAQRRAQADAKKRAEADARRRAQADAQRRAQADAQRRAQADAQRRAQADAQRRARADAKSRADADARRRSQVDAQRRAETDSRRRAQTDAQRRAATEASRQAALDRQKQADAEARRRGADPRVSVPTRDDRNATVRRARAERDRLDRERRAAILQEQKDAARKRAERTAPDRRTPPVIRSSPGRNEDRIRSAPSDLTRRIAPASPRGPGVGTSVPTPTGKPGSSIAPKRNPAGFIGSTPAPRGDIGNGIGNGSGKSPRRPGPGGTAKPRPAAPGLGGTPDFGARPFAPFAPDRSETPIHRGGDDDPWYDPPSPAVPAPPAASITIYTPAHVDVVYDDWSHHDHWNHHDWIHPDWIDGCIPRYSGWDSGWSISFSFGFGHGRHHGPSYRWRSGAWRSRHLHRGVHLSFPYIAWHRYSGHRWSGWNYDPWDCWSGGFGFAGWHDVVRGSRYGHHYRPRWRSASRTWYDDVCRPTVVLNEPLYVVERTVEPLPPSLAEAWGAFEDDRPSLAADLFESIIAARPGDDEARLGRALALAALGDLRGSTDDLRRAMAAGATILENPWRSAAFNARVRTIAAFAVDAVRANPDDPDAMLLLAVARTLGEDPAGAYHAIDRAIDLGEGSTAAYDLRERLNDALIGRRR